jgi:beta-glucosidase
MVHGSSSHYAGYVQPVPRLNIPALVLQDGPQGVGDGARNVTCWPSALTIVASWDVDNMYRFAAGVAREERRKGVNIWLGPMVNIARVPFGGRNYESFGEDPYLSSQMVRSSIRGAQSQGVMATVKHWVNNNQEDNRFQVSANLPDDRTQWEIYYPAFKAAVDAGVAAVMCSYNRINDTWACENDRTINKDLKDAMGFQGFVMSDWGATHSTVQSANSGLDMQMPDQTFFGKALAQSITNGQVPVSRLNDMVLRILTSMYMVGIMDTPQTGNLSVDVRTHEHTELARRLAEQSTVLLKNDRNILPLDATKLRTIAVIGDDAHDHAIYVGWGSGQVYAETVVTPLMGIKAHLARRGLSVNVLYVNNSVIANAVAAAQKADMAIVFAGVESSEGYDRANMSLFGNNNELIQAVAAAQRNTVVGLHIPGATLMPWIDSVPAVLAAFMPGQEDGHAIASVLFGEVNPGGKLPLTFPKTDTQTYLQTKIQYPGIGNETRYTEKLLVGHRWYDAANVEPLFPFGHGLSYTTFKYSNLQVFGRVITLDLTNTGSVEGSEVVQVYLEYPAAAGEPPKVLRGFEKVRLVPGQTQGLVFTFSNEELSIWDQTTHGWALVKGTFKVHVGSSSRDIRLTGSFNIA